MLLLLYPLAVVSPRLSAHATATAVGQEEVEPPARFQYEATEDMLILAALPVAARAANARVRATIEL